MSVALLVQLTELGESIDRLKAENASLKETLHDERKLFFEELEKLKEENQRMRKALHSIHLIAAVEC